MIHILFWHWHSSPGTKWASAGRSPLTIILMTHLRTVCFPSLQLEGPGALNLQSPKGEFFSSRHLLSLISWDRQARRVTNSSQVFHWPAWCQAGPCGAPGHRGLLSHIPHRQDSSLHEFLLIQRAEPLLIKGEAAMKPRLKGLRGSLILGDRPRKILQHKA